MKYSRSELRRRVDMKRYLRQCGYTSEEINELPTEELEDLILKQAG